jgi:sorting nexin-7/30
MFALFLIFKPLKEYLLYIEAVKEALTRRDSVQIEYELTVEELKKKRADKELVSSCRITFLFFHLMV